MCMHMKEQKVEGVVLIELGLLQKVIEKLEMSIVSNCLECIRMGRGNRYVTGHCCYFMLNRKKMNHLIRKQHGR